MGMIPCGVIGVGYLGAFHAQKYQLLPGSRLIGVYDADRRRAREVAHSLNVAWFGRLEDLLGQVEAVSIAVPTSHHYITALQCLESGIHVLLEKPITETVVQARHLVTSALATGAVFQVGHLERFNPVLNTMAGKIDRPQRIEAVRQAPFNPRGSDVDVLLDLMIHDIDIVLDLNPAPIESITAHGSTLVTDHIDQGHACIRFADGSEAHLTASRIADRPIRKLEVYDQGLHLTMDYLRQTAIVRHDNQPRARGDRPIPPQVFRFKKTDTLMEQIDDFLTCIKWDKSPQVDGESGLRALELADAIRQRIVCNQHAGRVPAYG